MKVLIRKTYTGAQEYWDAKEKRIITVPAGVEPEFEVVENPDSMIYKSDNKKDESEGPFLENMNAKQLRAYAAENEITIPFEIKKTEDIRKFLINYEDSHDEDGEDNEVL